MDPIHPQLKDDGTPLYRQIADVLLTRIRDDGLRVGERIDSEPEIVAAYGVSRATATRALEHLARQGVVRRVQGRGTFVQVPPLMLRQPVLGSFSAQVEAAGHRPAHRLLGVTEPDGSEDPRLHAHFAGEPVFRIDRVRLVDDAPTGVHRSLVARRAMPGDAQAWARALQDPHASLYAVLADAGARATHAEEHLDALVADAQDAELLELEPPAALMRVVRLSTDQDGRPLEATDARYSGNRFDYRVTLALPEGGTRNRMDPQMEEQA
jgi:GntR family transcriptional regulator